MYRLINKHIQPLLRSIDRDKDIEPYRQLIAYMDAAECPLNKDFRSRYRQYWKMTNVQVTPRFADQYFLKLESLRFTRKPEIEVVARQLYKFTNEDKRPSLQFSFATKLVHMLDRDAPIYDSSVRSFFLLRDISWLKNAESKLPLYLDAYQFLKAEYERVIRESLLKKAITAFRNCFHVHPSGYTDVKVIDTLIWKFVSFMEMAAPSERRVIYS
jgi:hypothetical protein